MYKEAPGDRGRSKVFVAGWSVGERAVLRTKKSNGGREKNEELSSAIRLVEWQVRRKKVGRGNGKGTKRGVSCNHVLKWESLDLELRQGWRSRRVVEKRKRGGSVFSCL